MEGTTARPITVTDELTQEQKFKFRLRMEQEAEAAAQEQKLGDPTWYELAEKGLDRTHEEQAKMEQLQKDKDIGFWDYIQGGKTGEVAYGGLSPLLGLAQFAGEQVFDPLLQSVGYDKTGLNYPGDSMTKLLNDWDQNIVDSRQKIGNNDPRWRGFLSSMIMPMQATKAADKLVKPLIVKDGSKLVHWKPGISVTAPQAGATAALTAGSMPVLDETDPNEQLGERMGRGAVGFGLGTAAQPAITGVGKVTGAVGNYLDDLTRPWTFRNKVGGAWDHLVKYFNPEGNQVALADGTKVGKGIYKDVANYLNNVIDDTADDLPARDKIYEAIVNPRTYVAGNKPTVGQAISDASRKSPTGRFGSSIVRLEQDAGRSPGGTDILKSQQDVYQKAREFPLIRSAYLDDPLSMSDDALPVSLRQTADTHPMFAPKTDFNPVMLSQQSDDALVPKLSKIERLEAERSANAARNFGKVKNKVINTRTPEQARQESMDKVNAAIASRQNAKLNADRDAAHMKNLAGQQERLSHNPVVNHAPPGSPKVPNRYTPHVTVQQQASGAADEFAALSKEHNISIQSLQSLKGALEKSGLSGQGLDNFMNRPAFIKALNEARDGYLNKHGNWPPDQGVWTVEALSRINKSLANEINRKEGGKYVLDKIVRGELNDMKGQFQNWLYSKAKGLQSADDAFAADSIPLNQAKLSESLLNQMRNPSGMEKQTGILKAMEDQAKAIKKGDGGYAKNLKDVYKDTGIDKHLQNVAKEGERDLYMQAQARQTDPILSSLSKETEPLFPRILNSKAAISNWVLQKVGKDATPQYEAVLAHIMKDPKNLQVIMEMRNKAVPEPMILDTINKMIANAQGVGATKME